MPATNLISPRTTPITSQHNNNGDHHQQQQLFDTPEQHSPQSSYNSSYGSNSGKNLINSNNNNNSNLSSPNNSASIPGGLITTQNISTVIKPQANNKSLQFVKIQTPELSKKAVEQIKLAEETKISKSTIKEVEEQEWHNQLLDWKSRRKQHFGSSNSSNGHSINSLFDDQDGQQQTRKVKTFAEMLEQRSKSGNRLGAFHLQRYIGDDSEEQQVAEETSAAAAANRQKSSLAQNNTHSSNNSADGDGLPLSNSSNADSDAIALNDENKKQQLKLNHHNSNEALSSTSSGFNQPDSKSPSSPDIPQSHHDEQSLKNLPQTTTCDKNNISIINNSNHDNNLPKQYNNHDEPDHAMSFGGKSTNYIDQERLNSTFKQSLILQTASAPKNTQVKSNIIKSANLSPAIDSRKREISAFRGDQEEESDNSVFGEEEEGEEEDEEQKQLQRIAFEAKLKAFEQLTIPGTKIPKPPTRVPPKPPTSMKIKQNKNTELYDNKSSFEGYERVEPPTRSRKDRNNLDERLPINQSYMHDDRLQTTISNLALQSPSTQKRDSDRQGAVKPQPSPQMMIQNLKFKNEAVHRPLPSSPPTLPSNLVGYNQMLQEQKSELSQKSFNQSVSAPIPPARPDQFQSMKNILPIVDNNNSTSIPMTPKTEKKTKNIQFHHHQTHQPPLPSEPTKNTNLPTPRKHNRDDKETTGLSVSGKKRCSSCKEELGRGAAAFVVESLSLVYHTNCFRCSVCHVNLSNGFRGVDVRVHAGALHCQNCYSRDGLNFSRV